jgi:hypothetical protein
VYSVKARRLRVLRSVSREARRSFAPILHQCTPKVDAFQDVSKEEVEQSKKGDKIYARALIGLS